MKIKSLGTIAWLAYVRNKYGDHVEYSKDWDRVASAVASEVKRRSKRKK